MANRINEVWYCYNAKGKKIPPYKSSYVHQKTKTLIGKVWCMFKENWLSVIMTLTVASIVMGALIYAMFMLLA
jgi:hypothetical protein